MQLDMTPAEAEVLDDVLRSALGDLKEQIYKSEVTEYRAGLKEREATIVSLLERLRAPA